MPAAKAFAVAVSGAVLVVLLLLTASAPRVLQGLTLGLRVHAGTPVSASTPHTAQRPPSGPLTFSEYAFECVLFPGGASQCRGFQGGQTYPRMFFSLWFSIGPWAPPNKQNSQSPGAPAQQQQQQQQQRQQLLPPQQLQTSAADATNRAYSFSCNLYADNNHFCFATPPQQGAQRAAGMFIQLAYQASPSSAAPLISRRVLPVTAATADSAFTAGNTTDQPRWDVECYVSADGTLLCLQPSGGEGTPTANIRLAATLLDSTQPARQPTAPGSVQGAGLVDDPPHYNFECDVTVDGGQVCAGPQTDPKGTVFAQLAVAVLLQDTVET